MARGPRKHLKKLNAPHHWMLSKLSGKYAPKVSPGPHSTRASMPLIVLLRNRLRYALNGKEASIITMQRLVKVDGKVRTDTGYPAGFQDVVSLDKTNEHFRLLYDVKGRFAVHRITEQEAKFKLCRVRSRATQRKGVPYIVTHDGRTLRYCDPDYKVNDTIKIDLKTGKAVGHIRFEVGNLAMITGGHNMGRVGVVMHRDRHPGSFDIVHLKDANGHTFATRLSNVFIIGEGNKALVSLPRGKGLRLSNEEDRAAKLASRS